MLSFSRFKVELLSGVVVWVLGGLALSTHADYPTFSHNSYTLFENVVKCLGAKLSSASTIYTPGTEQFANATSRWTEWKAPNVALVVQVISEADIVSTVQCASHYAVPFLAVGAAHGAIKSLAELQMGIQIWTTSMNSVTIASDGQSATVGPGALAKDVADTLYAQRKWTVHGACECTGVMGPALGGGYGFLQGQYGLAADQIISARIVLANGTLVTASAISHPDLYWGIKGAGHNFGVVTSLQYKIYDVPAIDFWTYETFIYTQDKLEALYTAINTLTANGTQPAGLINFSLFTRVPAIDPVNPVIVFYIIFQGTAAQEALYAAPFHALSPAVVQASNGTYPDLFNVLGNGNSSAVCVHGQTWQRFPISLQSYSTVAQRKVFMAFSLLTKAYPALDGSSYAFEGYAVAGVRAVPDASTAFAHRQDNIMLSPLMVYAPNATLDPIVAEFGNAARDILYEYSGSPELHVYVNYAHGDETLQQIYGYERWRQEKLKALKTLYDPMGYFDFYAPISRSHDFSWKGYKEKS